MCTKMFLNIKYVICLLLVYVTARELKPELLSIDDCDLPKDIYDEDNLVPHNWTLAKVKGETIIKANFTIVKKTPPVFYSLRGYNLPEKAIELNVSRLTCTNVIVELFLKRTKVVYDEKTCVGFPGTYNTKKVSINEFFKHHTYLLVGYRQYLVELELSTDKGVMICVAVTLDFK